MNHQTDIWAKVERVSIDILGDFRLSGEKNLSELLFHGEIFLCKQWTHELDLIQLAPVSQVMNNVEVAYSREE